jgi:molecular chaperone DnaK
MGRPLLTCIAGAALAAAVCACGSTAGPAATPTASPTATAVVNGSSRLDRCLVGTWKSIGISGSLTVGGADVNLSGGAGEVLTIAASGAIRSDDSATAPITGSAPDGTAYELAQTGTGTGTIIGAAGEVTIALVKPNTVTTTLYKNGTAVQTQHPGSANDSYTCTPGSALILTSAAGTVIKYSSAG